MKNYGTYIAGVRNGYRLSVFLQYCSSPNITIPWTPQANLNMIRYILLAALVGLASCVTMSVDSRLVGTFVGSDSESLVLAKDARVYRCRIVDGQEQSVFMGYVAATSSNSFGIAGPDTSPFIGTSFRVSDDFQTITVHWGYFIERRYGTNQMVYGRGRVKKSLPTEKLSATSIVAKVDSLLAYPRRLNPKSLSETEKKEVIEELRRRAPRLPDPGIRWMPEAASAFGIERDLLLRLGDEQTMADLVKYAQECKEEAGIDNAISLLQNSKNPAVIPHAAALLYYSSEDEMLRTNRNLVAVISQSIVENHTAAWAARTINYIIEQRPEFSREVKDWLSKMTPFETRMIATARCLWEGNKEAFLRHDYAAVKPPANGKLPEPQSSNQVPSAPPHEDH